MGLVGHGEGGLRVEEMVVADGGSWSGLLFDNPHIGLPAQLTWEFTFRCQRVERPEGGTPVSLTVDWVPLPGCRWWDMTGQAASGSVFGEPIEASVYFFEHHRYDEVALRVLDRRGHDLLVRAELAGDIDELGIPAVGIEGWLAFGGIVVSLSDRPTTADEALARLGEHVDPTGLIASPSAPGGFRFGPGPGVHR